METKCIHKRMIKRECNLDISAFLMELKYAEIKLEL